MSSQNVSSGWLRSPVTAWKVSKYGVFSAPYFPAFWTEYEEILSPKTGKYGSEKTPHLDTCHAVHGSENRTQLKVFPNYLFLKEIQNSFSIEHIWISVSANDKTFQLLIPTPHACTANIPPPLLPTPHACTADMPPPLTCAVASGGSIQILSSKIKQINKSYILILLQLITGPGIPESENRVKKPSYALWRDKTELSQIVTSWLIFHQFFVTRNF